MDEGTIRKQESLHIVKDFRWILDITLFKTELANVIHNGAYFGEVGFSIE